MGYDLDRFVGEIIDSELVCNICKLVLQDPVETPCEHFFCNVCITDWLSTNRMSCPTDRKPLRECELKRRPNRLLRSLLNKLEIKCDFEDESCSVVVRMEDLAEHRSTCSRNPETDITCDNGCNLTIKRRDQATHCFDHFKNKINSQDDEILNLYGALQNRLFEKGALSTEINLLQHTVWQQEAEIDRLQRELDAK